LGWAWGRVERSETSRTYTKGKTYTMSYLTCKIRNRINYREDLPHEYMFIGTDVTETQNGKYTISKIHATCKFCGVLNTTTQIEDSEHSYSQILGETEGK
jgi:hypothetical protein